MWDSILETVNLHNQIDQILDIDISSKIPGEKFAFETSFKYINYINDRFQLNDLLLNHHLLSQFHNAVYHELELKVEYLKFYNFDSIELMGMPSFPKDREEIKRLNEKAKRTLISKLLNEPESIISRYQELSGNKKTKYNLNDEIDGLLIWENAPEIIENYLLFREEIGLEKRTCERILKSRNLSKLWFSIKYKWILKQSTEINKHSQDQLVEYKYLVNFIDEYLKATNGNPVSFQELQKEIKLFNNKSRLKKYFETSTSNKLRIIYKFSNTANSIYKFQGVKPTLEFFTDLGIRIFRADLGKLESYCG